MRFLVFYQTIANENDMSSDRDYIVQQLAPAFSAGLLEDVIFITDHNPRHHEIIDLTPEDTSPNCPISLEEVMTKIKANYHTPNTPKA